MARQTLAAVLLVLVFLVALAVLSEGAYAQGEDEPVDLATHTRWELKVEETKKSYLKYVGSEEPVAPGWSELERTREVVISVTALGGAISGEIISFGLGYGSPPGAEPPVLESMRFAGSSVSFVIYSPWSHRFGWNLEPDYGPFSIVPATYYFEGEISDGSISGTFESSVTDTIIYDPYDNAYEWRVEEAGTFTGSILEAPTPATPTPSAAAETATASPTPAPAATPTATPVLPEGERVDLGPIEEEGNEYTFSFELPEGYSVVEETRTGLTAYGPLIGIAQPSPDELRVITVETSGEGMVAEAARQWAEAGCPEEERPEIVAEGSTSLGETDGYFVYRACMRETTTGPVAARLDLVVLIAPGEGRFVGLTADHRLSDFAWSEPTPGERAVSQPEEIGGRPAAEVHRANLDAILASLKVSIEDLGAPQTEFVASVPGPDEISTDPEVIGSNLFLTLFVVFAFAFTSTLFNQTLDENRREIEGWVGRLFTPFRRLTSLVERQYAVVTERRPWVQRMAGPALILVLTGLIYGFLSPDFGFNAKSVVLFASLVVGMGAITYVYEGGQALFTTRRFRLAAGVKLYAVALAIAAGCVLLSRLVDFQPGFLFGFVASYTLLAPAALDRRQSGQLVLFPAIALLALSVIAWLLVIPLREVTQGGDAWWVALPEGAVVAVFVVGLEGLFFNMIPLSFMDGAKIAEWNRLLWFLMFGAAGFLFWHVLLNQEGAYLDALPEKRVIAALSLLAFYSIITLVTWAYFHGRVYGWAIPSMATVQGTVVGWARGAIERAPRIHWRRRARRER
jgi:hypothetical protein